MTHEFTVVLASPHLTEEQCNALYESGCDDGTISTSQGTTRIDFARQAASLEEAIRSALANVGAAGLQVVRAEITPANLVQSK